MRFGRTDRPTIPLGYAADGRAGDEIAERGKAVNCGTTRTHYEIIAGTVWAISCKIVIHKPKAEWQNASNICCLQAKCNAIRLLVTPQRGDLNIDYVTRRALWRLGKESILICVRDGCRTPPNAELADDGACVRANRVNAATGLRRNLRCAQSARQ